MRLFSILSFFFVLGLCSTAGATLDLCSTPTQVLMVLGNPKKIEEDNSLGLLLWKYPRGEVTFHDGKVIGFDQTKDFLSFDLGKREEGVFLSYWMEAAEIPRALGTPSKIEADRVARRFALWHYKDIPAPDGEMGCVAVNEGRVIGWSIGDRKNYYACYVWEEGKDEPELPIQRRLLKQVGPPSACVKVVKNGRMEKEIYIFHMQRSGIYQIEFREDLPNGYQVTNPGGNLMQFEKLASVHPPKSSRMTRREVLILQGPPDKVITKKPVWDRFRCRNCR